MQVRLQDGLLFLGSVLFVAMGVFLLVVGKERQVALGHHRLSSPAGS